MGDNTSDMASAIDSSIPNLTDIVEPTLPGNAADLRPSVLIIGAGVSGLATGCYLQMNGFNTHILERHTLPGGCCTAWACEGYVFDYCIEWLFGSGLGNDANQVWQELGALDGKIQRDFELFNRVVSVEGETVDFYNDPDRLEAHLLSISPIDKKQIKIFCEAIRGFIHLDLYPALTPKPLQSWREKIKFIAKILPSFALLWRTGATSLESFSEKLKNPFLKKAMPFIFFQDHECFPILPYVYNMAQAHKGNAGFPEGGSLGLSRSIEDRYLNLGGHLTYGVKVKHIVIEPSDTVLGKKAKAIGVELKNKKRFYADYIVSAADGYSTLFEMLDEQYLSPRVKNLYEKMLSRKDVVYPGVVSVFVGFKGRVGLGEPHSTTFMLPDEQAETLPGCMQKSILVQHRSRFTEGFSPEGCSVIHMTYLSDFDQWNTWRTTNKPLYRVKKQQISDFIYSFLEQRYPGITHDIEVVEVATPVTQKRYTGNTQGSILGWKAFTKAEDLANELIDKDHMQLPALDNFYMAGQWIGGGGLIRAALSGRYVAQFMCDALDKPFETTINATPERWNNAKWGLNMTRRKINSATVTNKKPVASI